MASDGEKKETRHFYEFKDELMEKSLQEIAEEYKKNSFYRKKLDLQLKEIEGIEPEKLKPKKDKQKN